MDRQEWTVKLLQKKIDELNQKLRERLRNKKESTADPQSVEEAGRGLPGAAEEV